LEEETMTMAKDPLMPADKAASCNSRETEIATVTNKSGEISGSWARVYGALQAYLKGYDWDPDSPTGLPGTKR
jgi:hypothetical protein